MPEMARVFPANNRFSINLSKMFPDGEPPPRIHAPFVQSRLRPVGFGQHRRMHSREAPTPRLSNRIQKPKAA
jgi:hypothetical protein